MKTLSDRINMKFGIVEGALTIENVNSDGFDAHEAVQKLCEKFNINVKNISGNNFDYTAFILNDFCKNADDETGDTVSIWLD